jgi:dUTP pyrophosphatase
VGFIRSFERLSTAKTMYDLPKRSTKHSAGYDFIAPYRVVFKPKEITLARTGVKAQMLDDEVLLLFNRSSNPKKKNLVLINGVGVIDADYYNNPDNEGEILFAFYNMSDEEVVIEKGEKLGQGMFTGFFKTTNEILNDIEERKGGFGSTGN